MMLFNTMTNTYHPIFYFESPSYANDAAGLTRFRSKAHDTNGFATREEALASIEKLETAIKEKTIYADVKKELDGDFHWNGAGIPSDTQFRKY